MGQLHVGARAGTPRHIAEGSEALPEAFASHTDHAYFTHLLAQQMLCQPSEEQEDKAAWVLSQHLNPHHAQHVVCTVSKTSDRSPPSHCLPSPQAVAKKPWQDRAVSVLEPQGLAPALAGPCPVAEGRESIAAFHPSWHLRAAQQTPSEEPPTSSTNDDTESGLMESFWRPAGIADGTAAQRQPSIAAQAGCSNFSSHVVSMKQAPIKQGASNSKPWQHNPIDDAVLSSEESEGNEEGAGYADYESEEGVEEMNRQYEQDAASLQSSGPALIGRVQQGRIGEHPDDIDSR